ncbi:MAG TPA: AI-2E family transporter, partial [Candidatus Caenarcaniphilales bacterium]
MKEPPAKIWEYLSNLTLTRFLLFFASGWAIVQLLAYFETVIVIFAFAAILAFLLNYPVGWLSRYLPHSVSVGLVFLLSITVISSLGITVGLAILSQGQQLIDSITNFLGSLIPLVTRLEAVLQARNIQVDLEAIEAQIRNQVLAGIGLSLAILQASLANLVTLILISVVAFFMVLDGKRLWQLALKLVPKHVRNQFSATIQRNFLGFFRGQLILVLFLTTSTFLVFLLLRVPFPLILAVIAGIFDLIPGIGATLGIGMVCLIVLSQNVWLAFKVLIACILLQQVQDNLIAPRIMQNSLNVNPVVV